ncbi:dephospho-CoA kinase [Aliirhizobium terrae]|uniref:dephospho-CoA kinase n=1 Tax=Terrirhizobium terrae TaxID=2926709 RepID=UPI00257553C9|nr:dephospho-CoA kinase [Rhizobium sp. CC-CFT758]WJH41645.1 dephospho-CoA kinase [Rhizobium sp. CC-CFT758]
MIVIGLTGSIGMGKSTTAAMFAAEGIPVNDPDAVVHDLYRSDAVKPVGTAFPGVVRDGVVDRAELGRQLSQQPDGFRRLEAIVHPLVRAREKQFLEMQKAAGADLVLLDIPLLFETGGENRVDSVVVITCDPQIQRQRVLARPGMTEEKFKLILDRQVPDQEKRACADFIIDTSDGMDAARTRVRQIIELLRSGVRSERNA